MDKPIYGKQYRLTGATGVPAISNGNSWAESELKTCIECGKDTPNKLVSERCKDCGTTYPHDCSN